MALSARLFHLHQLYGKQPLVYDIGCDHGSLGLSLVNYPSIEQIHLVDPSEPVIKKLKKTVIDSYITKKEKIIIHHCSGEKLKLNIKNKKLLYIAGMGGKNIASILERLSSQINPNDQIIISPHRSILELRHYLNTSEFKLIHEEVIIDSDQFYQILTLQKGAGETVHPFGDQLWKSENGHTYLKHQLIHFQIHRDPLSQCYVEYLKTLRLN